MSCNSREVKCGSGKCGESSVKHCSIPPPSEAFTEHVHICLIQVAIWKAALVESPREIDSTKYVWELDHLNILVPRTVHCGSLSAPPDILQLIHCNCKASGCRTEHVASRKLGAPSSFCLRVWKPVTIL